MSIHAPYPPLISPRSPSYGRAREESQHPSPLGVSQVIALFARLSEAEENASRAHLRIASTLTDTKLASRVRGEAKMHEAARAFLGELIEQLGGSAPTDEECRNILASGTDAAERAVTDEEELQALTVVRDELYALYVESLASPYLDMAQREALAVIAHSVAAAPAPQ